MKQGGTAGLDYSDPSLTDRFKTDLLRTGLLFRKWFKTVKHISIRKEFGDDQTNIRRSDAVSEGL